MFIKFCKKLSKHFLEGYFRKFVKAFKHIFYGFLNGKLSYNASSFSNGKGGCEVSDFITSCPRAIECA
jgi:hypothetical protein